jgi:hypothetical protein
MLVRVQPPDAGSAPNRRGVMPCLAQNLMGKFARMSLAEARRLQGFLRQAGRLGEFQVGRGGILS